MQRHRELAGIVLLGLGLSCQAPVATEPETLPGDAWHTTPPATASGMEVESPAAMQEDPDFWSPEEGLQRLLSRAQEQGPAVQVAFAAWQAASQKEDQVTALPNPWISLGAYLQAVETRSGPMDGRIGIQQPIPWPGKLASAGREAAALAEAKRWALESARLEARVDFLKPWVEMTYLQQAILIARSQVVLLEHIEEVSLRLYETSRVTQAEVLRAQVELLEMEDRLATLEQKTRAVLPRLERVLGARLQPGTEWKAQAFPELPELASSAELRQRMQLHAPRLQELARRQEAAQARQETAELEDRPDLALSADWTWIGTGNLSTADAGEDAFAVSLAVELPLHAGAIDAGRREALAVQRRVVQEIELQAWDLNTTMEIALSDLADAERRIVLYREQLLPKAEQTYETTLVAYQSAQAGFQDMLDAARVILDFRLAAIRAEADAHLAFATLQGLMPLSRLVAETLPR